jgi:glycosyltransferase involved in cell wall biosynthesis
VRSPGPRRIALVHPATSGWAAADGHFRMLVHSLAAVCDERGTELVAIVPEPRSYTAVPASVRVSPAPPPPNRGRRAARAAAGGRLPSPLARALRGLHADVSLLSATFHDEARFVRAVGWIPDFQHVHLPEFFEPPELEARDASFRGLAAAARLILCSSEAARGNFASFSPEYASKGRVARFPSLLAFEEPPASDSDVLDRFGVPEKFALVVNQFWRHKNARVVVAAAAELRRRHVEVPVVLIGLPWDYRDPLNAPISETLQDVARLRLRETVTVLGGVARADLLALLRRAAVVIQPSLFEGWGTTVQDAKALGRPVVCSDIAVHREQAPEAVGLFAPGDPGDLADLLERVWPDLAPGPDLDREAQALERERSFARAHGEALFAICSEAAGR